MGGAAATGQPTAEPYTPAGTDRATEPTLARLGQLFWTGLSAQGVSADQSFRAGPLGTTPAPTQSAWLAWPARSQPVRSPRTSGLGGVVDVFWTCRLWLEPDAG